MKYEDFVKPKYKPKKTDLICEFKLKLKPKTFSFKKGAGAVAAESSIGTWTELKTEKAYMKKLAAIVFEISKPELKISYPVDLFEAGSVPQLLSSVAGNIFGMKDLKTLRLQDISFPKKYVKSFKGPKFGIEGVRKTVKVKDRPLTGTIVKPKLGLNATDHAKVAYDAWSGGLDLVKEDENLADMSFNRFTERQKKVFKLKEKVERETGEKKIYLANVTAESKEMVKRAKLVKDLGGESIMLDILTVGWSAFQTLREENEELKLILHGHRASHAAVTRNKDHGITMLVLAKLSRLIGIDNLHIGAIVGKMEAGKKEVQLIRDNIVKQEIKEDKKNNILNQKWFGLKSTFPVCSGGLYPGCVESLVKYMGKDIIIQAGGGVSGHPRGVASGAVAMRQAVDAVMEGVPLREYANSYKELKIALDKWGIVR